jgi:hypothetical protein
MLFDMGPGKPDFSAGFGANQLFDVVVDCCLHNGLEIGLAFNDRDVRPNMDGDLILPTHALRSGIDPSRRFLTRQ